MDSHQVQEKCRNLMEKLGRYFVAEEKQLLMVLCGVISGGHLLFEDNPGLGKTLLVKLLAGLTGSSWGRIQFTPDLMPADIVGTRIWNARDSQFVLEKGPVFTNLLLADEINRAMPKTQSALLEAMEEEQVTIEGETFALKKPFLVLATQNPVENEGTYPLPEAQLDRFTMKLSLGYVNSVELEQEIMRRRIKWKKDDPSAEILPVMSQQELLRLQEQVETVYVDENILQYIGEIVWSTRQDERVRLGASPRGSLAMLRLSRSMALLSGREFVIPDDVKEIAGAALSHRLVLDMDYALDGVLPEEIIEEIVYGTAVPKDFKPGK